MVDDFINLYFFIEKLEVVGKLILNNEGYVGEYMFDDEKEMMWDLFCVFVFDVVMLLVEYIYIKDLDIFDEIFKLLVELGCFGLFIFMQYGGIQFDDSEDNFGMIVVIEEFFCGFFGVVGSLIICFEIMVCVLLKGGIEDQK